MTQRCTQCRQPVHKYSAEFVALWTDASRFFPLYALPTPETCGRCAESGAAEREAFHLYIRAKDRSIAHYLASLEEEGGAKHFGRWSTVGLKFSFTKAWLEWRLETRPTWDVVALMPDSMRQRWLQSGKKVVVFNPNDPVTKQQLKHGAKVKRDYEKLIEKQRKLKLRLHNRRIWRKVKREMKVRNKAIEVVLDQAAQLASEP